MSDLLILGAVLVAFGYFVYIYFFREYKLPPLADGVSPPKKRAAKKYLEDLVGHLNPEEEVQAWVYGLYEAPSFDRKGVIVLTNERVLAYASKLGGHELEALTLSKISSVQYSSGMIKEGLTINRSGGDAEVDYVSDGDAQLFQERSQSLIG